MRNTKSFTGHILFSLVINGAIFASGPALSTATRIWYEDCESTEYTSHFLENQFGSNYENYWNQFVNEEYPNLRLPTMEIIRLSTNPLINGSPYSQTGIGSSPYGNLSQFNFGDYAKVGIGSFDGTQGLKIRITLQSVWGCYMWDVLVTILFQQRAAVLVELS